MLVGWAVDGEEVERVLAEGATLGWVEQVGAGGPSVAEGDNVVDLDGATGSGATDEVDGGAGVGVVQSAGQNEAAVKHSVDEIALQNNIAHVAAVHLAPAGIKIGADVFGRGVVRFDFQLFEDGGSEEFGTNGWVSFGLDWDGLVIAGVGDQPNREGRQGY